MKLLGRHFRASAMSPAKRNNSRLIGWRCGTTRLAVAECRFLESLSFENALGPSTRNALAERRRVTHSAEKTRESPRGPRV